jgi:hypothetical protein
MARRPVPCWERPPFLRPQRAAQSLRLAVCELHVLAAAWRQRGGNGERQKQRGNLQLRQPTLIISSVTETSRAIFGASPPLNFRYQHNVPSPKQKSRPLQPQLVTSRRFCAFVDQIRTIFLCTNQSRWPQQSRVPCPLTSSLATPLATATSLSLPASTMARPDHTWLVLHANLNMVLLPASHRGLWIALQFEAASCPVQTLALACKRPRVASHRSFS